MSIAQIRRYFRRCLHLIEAYQLGMPYKLAEFAHKKYQLHPRFPEIDFNLLEAELLDQNQKNKIIKNNKIIK